MSRLAAPWGRLLALALATLVALEAWGGLERLWTVPTNVLHRPFAKELEASCRRLEIPPDARVLVLTSLFEPMPIVFPLAPRTVRLGVHYPAEWFALGEETTAGSAHAEALLAAAEFQERGLWAEPEGLAARLDACDYVLTIGLDRELMAALRQQSGVRELEQEDLDARSIWFEVRR